MSEDADKGRFQLTQPVILANPQLDVPKPYKDPVTQKESGDPKYTARLVFDPASSDFVELKAMAVAAATAKHPGVSFEVLASPFKSGDAAIEESKKKLARTDKKYDGRLDYLAGKFYVQCRSQFAPLMAGIVNGKLVDIASDAAALIQKTFYAGAQVYAVLKVNAYDAVGSNRAGVQIFLNELMATGQGKKLSGGTRSAASTFAGVAGKLSAEDPTASW